MDPTRQSIRRELSVDSNNLSGNVRRQSSATNNRPPAVTVGSFGVVSLAAAFPLVCAGDILEALYRSKAVLVAGRSKTCDCQEMK